MRNWIAYAWRAVLVGLRQRDVGVVYGSSPHLLAALAAWVIAAARHTPFVMEVRDLWPQVLVDMGHLRDRSLLVRILRRLEEFLYGQADAVVVMAEGSRRDLLSRGIAADKVKYIPNGPDPQDFVPSRSRDELRRRYGFERLTAVYTGAHGPANGLNFLLDAAVQLRDIDIEIVLVGGGVEKRALLERKARDGLENVRFMDPIPKADIPDLLNAADIGLHVLADVELFRDSVSPNKLFDYMCAAIPVVTNTPGLVGDLVEDVACGIATMPRGIHEGLRRIFDLPPKVRAEMGANGRSWLVQHQSRAAMATRLRDVLEEVLAETKEMEYP